MKISKRVKSSFIALTLGLGITFTANPAFSAELAQESLYTENIEHFNISSTNYFGENQSFDSDSFKLELSGTSTAAATTIFGLPQNMGPGDRILRGIIAAGLIGTGVYGLSSGNINSTLSTSLIGVSVIPIATGATGYCPIYHLFGLEYSF